MFEFENVAATVLGWKQPARLVDGCSFFAGSSSSSFSPDQPKKPAEQHECYIFFT
jgi:hypothetical protein